MKRIITYDLAYADSEDYKQLYEALEEMGGEQLTESTYLIDTTLTQKEITAKIKAATYSDDKVFFISVDKEKKLFYSRIR